ncbi:hypothetical protein CEXT_83531 [Caerostris extrusa]|uniref:Uncharacterized protein n=1 Tax=Caerostris extrusa TaxID=172846 RepID=A0AAV4PMA3_CAEEX|nr:hypothetical protein CEXT_83531 [Caerostris extrusa]
MPVSENEYFFKAGHLRVYIHLAYFFHSNYDKKSLWPKGDRWFSALRFCCSIAASLQELHPANNLIKVVNSASSGDAYQIFASEDHLKPPKQARPAAYSICQSSSKNCVKVAQKRRKRSQEEK